ncbi:succinyl-diaminopimelate desuccinylase [Marivibrio halodurans]|uniref:Succinyl-diaminopimelate desuccinylase n=1 Tax=Marivibrio halodurans TaxID=2039722 RepID=A0A8J7RYA4_9PROT|nr:succinyl-diaminopimelate desuccinylase [Marivibrio halodurans]MBP5856615.1 succinyl-diaminopimelate desuccinylase [Marivibrio halodurans]
MPDETRTHQEHPSEGPRIDALALARDLIRCESVTPAEGGALDLLQEVLEKLGFDCIRLPFEEAGTDPVDNLYARIGREGPNLCFAGHTDVVPVGNPAGWTVDPFAAEVIDGTLFGRGASDMKGAIACFVAAAAAYLAGDGGEGKAGRGSISLLITGDEEGPSINGTRKMLPALAERGERIDACITGEPTNPTRLGEMMKIGRRGSLNGFLTVHGVQGHTGYVHLADNAAHRIVRMLNALLAMELDRGSEHFQPSTLAISTVDVGNSATNIVPGEARAVFNIRFNDLHSGASLEERLRAVLAEAAGEDARYDFEVRVSGESFVTPPCLLSELIAEACLTETGETCAPSTTGGTSDSRFIKDYCPMVVDFGLVGQTMHKVDERVSVSDIAALTRIYGRVIAGYFARA